MEINAFQSHWRYSRWDGTQDVGPFDPEAAMDQLSESMIDDGDLKSALQRLLRRGFRDDAGDQQSGLRDLIDRLRQQRKDTLERFDLNSVMDNLREQLDEIVKTERQGIERKLDEAASPQAGQKPDQSLQKLLQRMAVRASEQARLPATGRARPDPRA